MALLHVTGRQTILCLDAHCYDSYSPGNMSARILSAGRQRSASLPAEEQAYINLLRTADALSRPLAELLKVAELSLTQYNVLRILRGAGPEGLPCRDVARRMVTRDPDITRLLDRLEVRGLVHRSREQHDRRVVTTRITDEGLKLLDRLDRPVADLHIRQLGHMSGDDLHALVRLTEQARRAVDEGA
jgi:DNA-binding MarR family transcriptional regulator